MKRNNKLCDVLRVCFAKNEKKKKTFPKLRLQFLKYDFNSPTSGKCAGEGEFQAMAKSRFEAKLCLVSCQLHWGLSLSISLSLGLRAWRDIRIEQNWRSTGHAVAVAVAVHTPIRVYRPPPSPHTAPLSRGNANESHKRNQFKSN